MRCRLPLMANMANTQRREINRLKINTPGLKGSGKVKGDNMIQSIHLLDPVTGTADKQFQYITARCGRVKKAHEIEVTTNPSEVTCIKCRIYINNPWRVLRKYGRVKVVESFYALLWADYGYPFDVVATIDTPLEWHVTISRKNEIHDVRRLQATTMADLGFLLVKLIENEIKKQQNHERN